MISSSFFCFMLLLLLLQKLDTSLGLVAPSSQTTKDRTQQQPTALYSAPPPTQRSKTRNHKRNRKSSSDMMLTEMRADIDRMKREAAERLEALSEKLVVVSKQKEQEETLRARERQEALKKKKQREIANGKTQKPWATAAEKPAATTGTTPGRDAATDDDDSETLDSLAEMADEFRRDMTRMEESLGKETQNESPASTNLLPLSTLTTDTRHPLKLLDDTRWRLCLNVGRVPGTWMPKTWGASGDKLHLKLEVEFTPDELYEREDFFGGVSDGSKVLRVVHGEASLAPSMNEGGRTVRIADGGWRVCPGEGPLGTHVLRFYFDVEEEARHLGSDVYLPRGRVFGTCGYFPMAGRSNVDGRQASKREIYGREIRQMEVRYQSLQTELESNPDWFSLGKLRCFREMRDLRRDARKIHKAMDDLDVREPKKSTLRMSRDQSVGLTHRGGISCRKLTGLSEEYHVLGKFEVASIENREHSDYRDALLP